MYGKTKMKIKKFFAVLIVLFTLLSVHIAIAMPEQSTSSWLVDLYCGHIEAPEETEKYIIMMWEEALNGDSFFKKALDEVEATASELRSRPPYTQEQAFNEIRSMIDAGNFPNYILAKGEYRYLDGNYAVYAVYPTTNLRSQPNTKARIITVIQASAWPGGEYAAPQTCNYMGEWKSPQGDKWVIASLYVNGKKEIGFLKGEYVSFIFNDPLLTYAGYIKLRESFVLLDKHVKSH